MKFIQNATKIATKFKIDEKKSISYANRVAANNENYTMQFGINMYSMKFAI